eukprot:gene8822-biopygen2767
MAISKCYRVLQRDSRIRSPESQRGALAIPDRRSQPQLPRAALGATSQQAVTWNQGFCDTTVPALCRCHASHVPTNRGRLPAPYPHAHSYMDAHLT